MKLRNGWVSCDVGEATEGLEIELWRRLSWGKTPEKLQPGKLTRLGIKPCLTGWVATILPIDDSDSRMCLCFVSMFPCAKFWSHLKISTRNNRLVYNFGYPNRNSPTVQLQLLHFQICVREKYCIITVVSIHLKGDNGWNFAHFGKKITFSFCWINVIYIL